MTTRNLGGFQEASAQVNGNKRSLMMLALQLLGSLLKG
jgi:hypothetical protein